jgi:BlaI family transcriptional regulator, penicillinase repressor
MEVMKMADAERLPMSDAEREVLKVLWDHGPLGVKEVLAKFTEAGQEWSRSTVITLLQRLEKKGYVQCDKSQFAFVFEAAVSREDEMRARMNELASELCDGETLPLVLAFAQQHRFSADELARFRELIDSIKPAGKPTGKKRGGK